MKKAHPPTLTSQKGNSSEAPRLPKSRRMAPRSQPPVTPPTSPAHQESTPPENTGMASVAHKAAHKKIPEKSGKHGSRAGSAPTLRQTSRKVISDSTGLSPASAAKVLPAGRPAAKSSTRQRPQKHMDSGAGDGLSGSAALSPLPTAMAGTPPPSIPRTVRTLPSESPSLSSSLSSLPAPTAQTAKVVSRKSTITPHAESSSPTSDSPPTSGDTPTGSAPTTRSSLKANHLKASHPAKSGIHPRKRKSRTKRTTQPTPVPASARSSARQTGATGLFSIERQSINLYHHAMDFFQRADYAGARDTLRLLLATPSLDPEMASRARIFLKICSQKEVGSGATP